MVKIGEIDIDKLMEIYKFITNFCKSNQLFFKFTVDQGKFETAIEFIQSPANYMSHPPISKNWVALKKNGNVVLVPDILDYTNKIIIEYEEESQPMHGPKIIKKGHSEESKHDTDRDTFYESRKFRVFKVWESDKEWKKSLGKFLLRCNG